MFFVNVSAHYFRKQGGISFVGLTGVALQSGEAHRRVAKLV